MHLMIVSIQYQRLIQFQHLLICIELIMSTLGGCFIRRHQLTVQAKQKSTPCRIPRVTPILPERLIPDTLGFGRTHTYTCDVITCAYA